MGFFQDFFNSPRERQAPGMYQGQINSYDDIMKNVSGMQDSTAGVSDINTLRAKFGFTGTDKPFGAARRNLATQRARSLRSVSDRMSGSVANPEAVFSPVESDYAQASGQLETDAANADIGEQRYEAGMLGNILQGQNQFGFQKNNMKAGILGQKGNAIQDYLNSISGASSFDDLLALGNTVAKFIPKPA